MLKLMYFHADGAVELKSDFVFPEGGGCVWNFDNTRMGWRSPSGTNVQWTQKGIIKGEIVCEKPIIESANWTSTDNKGRTLKFRIRNKTTVSKIKFSFALLRTDLPRFWSYPAINWLEEASIVMDVKSKSSDFEEYKLVLDSFKNMPKNLKRLRIEFRDVKSGKWVIDYIQIQ